MLLRSVKLSIKDRKICWASQFSPLALRTYNVRFASSSHPTRCFHSLWRSIQCYPQTEVTTCDFLVKFQNLTYVRTCGTFMNDADIIANEKYFQAHKVVAASSAAVATLNVNHPA